MGRHVSTGVAILLGFLGFLAGAGSVVLLARMSAPVGGVWLLPLALALAAWLVRRRDVAVGVLFGVGGVLLMVVAALRNLD